MPRADRTRNPISWNWTHLLMPYGNTVLRSLGSVLDFRHVAWLPDSQHRLTYSLLKPAVRVAAKFGISYKILGDLVRLAYFEVLSREKKLSVDEVARRFGQTPRHMRSLARKMETNFFSAEREVGLAREIEGSLARAPGTEADVMGRFDDWNAEEVRHALTSLLDEGRLTEVDGHYAMSQRYVVLSSDQFTQRIDALNHFLDGATKAVLHRLVYGEREGAMIKTLSFAADPALLHKFVRRLEGELRTELADLDEAARFGEHGGTRFTMSITLAPERENEDEQ